MGRPADLDQPITHLALGSTEQWRPAVSAQSARRPIGSVIVSKATSAREVWHVEALAGAFFPVDLDLDRLKPL